MDWPSKIIEAMASGKRTTATHRALMWVGMGVLVFGQFDLRGMLDNLNRLPTLLKKLDDQDETLRRYYEELKETREDIRTIKEILRRHNLAINRNPSTNTFDRSPNYNALPR